MIANLTKEQKDYLEHAYCHSNCCDAIMNNDMCASCREHCVSQLEEDLGDIIGEFVTLKY